jgi:hypothetical protein
VLGEAGVFAFFLGQVAQELADAGVGRLGDGPLVELLGLEFHQLDLFADRIDPQAACQPDGPTLHEALHVLPSDEGDVIAELAAVQLDEPMAMAILFPPHFFEHVCGGGIVCFQMLGKVAINSGVFLFEGNRQGEDLLFAQAFEGSHGGGP